MFLGPTSTVQHIPCLSQAMYPRPSILRLKLLLFLSLLAFGGVYLYSSLTAVHTTTTSQNKAPSNKQHSQDKPPPGRLTAVVSALQKDDVSWLDELGWDVWKYEVDNPQALHATPANKGAEAMVYLT